MKEEARKHLEAEYGYIREEVLSMLKEAPANERWAVVSTAVFWAWFETAGKQHSLLDVLAFIPFLFSSILFIRWRGLNNKFDAINSYIRKIEQSFELDGLGWETFIDQDKKRHWFSWYQWPFWILLILGNLYLALAV